MNLKATMALFALTACVGLAACGGSDKKSSDSGTLSKTALAAKADVKARAHDGLMWPQQEPALLAAVATALEESR